MALETKLISFDDSPQIDSYGRLRSSSPISAFGLFMSNGIHPLYFNTATVGAGAVAFNANTSSARLSVSTGATDSIIVQTKRYLRYQPGYSYQLILAGVMGAAKTNVRQRLGYFDANDGIFFEQTSTGISIVTRTSTSGSPVDTAVTQANWNLDKLDGTGPSGITLDTSKYNAYLMDFVWQGAGRIRVGLMLNDKLVYCHQIFNSNVNTVPFMRSPSRPGRIELTNTGTPASGTNLDLTCVTALREANVDLTAPYGFSASNGVTNKTANSTTNLVPLISIRPKTTFNGITNRVPILADNFDVFAIQDSVYVRVLLNPTLTAASFNSAGTNSAVEFDVAATLATGGTTIYETYVPGGGKGLGQFIDLADFAVLGLDIAGSVQDTLTIAVLKLNANADSYAALRWLEFQ